MQPIIKVQGLAKRYYLGGPKAAYATLRETIMDVARRPMGSLLRNGNSPEMIWALKDVDFEIAPGEIVGIIGRNGAGKSTLLKILSRIVQPTEGRVELFGRVASLLEVGTGFHPELSGRENIFLNGSILGMTHKEIQSRFDEIVAFAEVEKFIDTPVKRFSSGMYVRLAFAVAAHLQPEILIIDEVLAVGDYNFQQKCLNKMQDVSTGGRTVLFVSHNLGAITRLCNRCLLLDGGRLIASGETSKVVQMYMTSGLVERPEYTQSSNPNKAMNILHVAVKGDDGAIRSDIRYDEGLTFEFEYETNQQVTGTSLGVMVNTLDGTCAFTSSDIDSHAELLASRMPGRYKTQMTLPAKWLNAGQYTLRVEAGNPTDGTLYDKIDTVVFRIVDVGTPGSLNGTKRPGILQPLLEWKTIKTSE